MRFIKKDTLKIIRYSFKNLKLNLFSKKKKFLKLYIQRVVFADLHFIFLQLTKNTRFLYNIMFTYFRTAWYMFITLQTRFNYYYLMSCIFRKFCHLTNKIDEKTLKIHTDNTRILYPDNILVDVKFKSSTIITPNLQFLKKFEKYLLKKLISGGIIKNRYFLKHLLYKEANYADTKFKLNFLRVQKSYNKRRYSKVRATSRSSFFGGITLSSIFLAILWGGTIKNTDWLSAKIVLIDVNLILFVLISYLLFRVYCIHNPSSFIRKKGKIYILYNLHNLFILKFFNKNNEK